MRQLSIFLSYLLLFASLGNAPNLAGKGSYSPGVDSFAYWSHIEQRMLGQTELQRDLEQINRQLLQWVDFYQKESISPSDLFFSPQQKGNLAESIPQTSLSAAQASSSQLAASKQFEQLSQALAQAVEQLEILCRKHPRPGKGELSELFAQLERIQTHFQQISEIQHKLIQFSGQPLTTHSPATSPWQPAQQQLLRLSLASREVLTALRVQDRPRLRKAQQSLIEEITTTQKLEKNLLNGLLAHPGSQRDPSLRYRATLHQAADFRAMIAAYLEGGDTSPAYAAYGAAYFFYTHQLSKKFNASDQGIRGQLIQFLALADSEPVVVLPSVVWWKALLPQADLSSDSTPHSFILLLDRSGSMRQPEKLPLLQRCLPALLAQMSPTDRLAIVSYGDDARLDLPFHVVADSAHILRTIRQLPVEGSSLPQEGLQLARQLAQEVSQGEQISLLMISDGGFRIDLALVEEVKLLTATQIPFHLFYMGRDELRMRKRLSGMASLGGGQYRYLRPGSARGVLLQVFTHPTL